VFPQGYPVARVTEVHRDAVQPLAHVRAAPLAHIDTDSEVMLVWFRADHPAAPTPTTDSLGELRSGTPSMQPQAVPPRPQVAAPGPSAAAPRPATPRKQPAESQAAEPKAAAPQPAAPQPATPEPATPEPTTPQPATPQPDASQSKEGQ
jgi:hypothetical protein